MPDPSAFRLPAPPAPFAPPPHQGPPGGDGGPPKARAFGDVPATRGRVFEAVFDAASKAEPVVGPRHTLRLGGLRWEDPDRVTKAEHKAAVLEGRTLGRRLRGVWELVDNATGGVVSRREQVVARVPYLTDLGTFVHRGTDYTVNHQARLLPGVYVRRRASGESEAHANVLPGAGVSHRYVLDPAKSLFHLEVGQSRLPLMPLLRAAGVTDDQLREAWGPDVLAANHAADDPAAVKKFADRLLRKKDLDEAGGDHRKALAARFAAMKLDPRVTRRTLGGDHDGFRAETLLAATRKVLALHRGEAEADDRDHLAYQRVLGPEDLFAERVGRDHGRLRRAILARASLRGDLGSVPAGALTPQLEQAILGSGLGQAVQEINPGEVLDRQAALTRMGEGGLPSTDSIPEESRAVQPSHLGYVDPSRTPESLRAGVDLFLARGARKTADGTLLTSYRDVRTGQTVWKSPEDVADAVVAFPNALKLPYDRVPVMRKGRETWARKDEVDYELPHMEDAFSPVANFVPFKSTDKGQRVAMGARMITQAVPLERPESPLVRNEVPGSQGRSFYEEYGPHFGALRSPDAGTVVSADRGKVTVRTDDGRTVEHELYDTFPFSRKSVTGDSVLVIRTAEGHYWRGTIADYGEVHRPGDRVLTVDPFKKVSGWFPVAGYVRHRNDKRLLRVRTRSGREVTVTEDHSLVTLDDRAEIAPVLPDDVVPGRTRLPVALFRAWEASTAGDLPDGLPLKALGELAGLYLAEGHCPPSQPGLVTIAVAPEGRAEEVKALLRSLGESPHRNGGSVTFTGHELCRWLVANFGHLSHNKSLAPWVFTAPRAFREALVRGYFAGDGCLWEAYSANLTAVSVSRDLRDAMVDLLGGFGVFCTLFDAPRAHLNENWRDAYGLRVINTHYSRLPRWFFYSDRETTFRRMLRPRRVRSSEFEAIPVTRAARKTVYAGYKAASCSVPKFIYKTAHLGGVAKWRVAELSGPYGAWGRSDVMWDPVEAVEEVAGPQEFVYDLCVSGAETFAVCSGLVVHNTYLHQTAVVKPGDKVNAGQLLARSNYTDDRGDVALGANARTAYIPWGGLNYEDAFVISEGMAKRFTSENLYQHGLQVDDKTEAGKKRFAGLFPSKFQGRHLDVIGDDGVIRPGETVEYGQPLILAARKREHAHNKVHRKGDAGYADASVVWEHHDPGVVTDVANGRDGPVVVVKSRGSMKVGDKMAGMHGDKGVVAAIIPDDKMPHDAQGRPYEVLANPLGLTSRCYDEQTEFLTEAGWKFGRHVIPEDRFVCFHPWTQNLYVLPQLETFHVAHYKGKMLKFVNKVMDFCVTPNHRMWARCSYQASPWQEVQAHQIYRRRWYVPVAGNPVQGVEAPFVLPHVPCHVKDTQSCRDEIVIDAGDWAEFLGWYVAEGNADVQTHISQCHRVNPEKHAQIAALLSRLPFAWNYNAANIQFHITSKRLAAYLAPLGKAHEKYVPDWVFGQPPHVRQRFLDAYWLGDGRKQLSEDGGASTQAGSVSERLIDDLQQLHVYQGLSARKAPVKVAAKARPFWRVGRHIPKFRTLDAEGWSEVDYDGLIYCPTVPTGYVVTRRNGKLLIAGNTNAAQIAEGMLGKVAAVTGRHYTVADFGDVADVVQFARDELAKHGVPDTEPIFDPTTGRKIDPPHYDLDPATGKAVRFGSGVLTGVRHYMKLHHTSESKGQARASGAYTSDEAPAKGGATGSKRISLIDSNALLAHGATQVLRDAAAVRGQRNDDYWLRFMQGHTPRDPDVPMVYDKFLSQLRAAGVNTWREGSKTHLLALTNKDVDALVGPRELSSGDTVRFDRGLEPVAGGLFDPHATGGHGGRKWAAVRLHEPLLNPVMEEPARRLLGLTQRQLEEVIAGDRPLAGAKGPGALRKALAGLDVDAELARARQDFKHGSASGRDDAARRVGYLKTLKERGLDPADWVLDRVPVLPPAFRPVSVMGDSGTPLVADANWLYKELIEANDNLGAMAKEVGDGHVGPERLALYQAFKAVTGLGDPVGAKTKEKQIKGILKAVLGTSPKLGTVQRRLISSTVDNVGRAVITPDPSLDMDHVGLPEDMAFKVYEKFVVRRLARRGLPVSRALREVRERTPRAREELVAEMDHRPVLVNRAPVLHKFGIMAHRPVLVAGSTLRFSPLVTKGYGADFDGDAVQFHVPTDEGARAEALERLLPSRSLLSPADFKTPVHMPSQEYVAGLYHATSPDAASDRPPRVFKTKADLSRAYAAGQVDANDRVTVLEH